MTKNITRNSAADIKHLATQPGGMPSVATMQPKAKFTVAKANYFAGLPFLTGISKDQTYKSNGDKEKIQQDWRHFDLPSSQLSPQCATHLHGMLARAEHRNQSLTVAGPAAGRIPEGMVPSQMPKVITKTLERIARLEGEQKKITTELAELERGGDGNVGNTTATAEAKLARVKKNLQSKTAVIDAEKKDAHDNAIAQLRIGADTALAALKAAPGDEACKAAYHQARDRLVESSTQTFFDAYCTLREHEVDQARTKGMQTMLPQLARQLELPAKYVQGLAALEEAKVMLDHLDMTPADHVASLAVIRDQLVGRRARDLTAGRTSELPGPPPGKSETDAWSAQASQVRKLADDFKVVNQLLGDTMPALKTRADAAQTSYLNDLVEHLPSYGGMTATQCADTADALRTLAGKLAANDVLQKDAPLPGMQLMHVVSMAESVTGNNPARAIALYQALATEDVHAIIGTALRNVRDGAPLDGAASDLVKIWEMSAHVVPETVNSLLACNPSNQVDWRDVQSFFRCSQELERLAAVPDAERGEHHDRHMDKMKTAMGALRNEVTTRQQPEVGSAERRDWAMVKSAVWAQSNVQHVEETFNNLHTTLALPGTTVAQMHDQFGKKLRGNVKGEARAEFKGAVGDLRDFAKTRLDNAATPQQRKDAALLLATSDYINAHRGTEKTLTKASRYLTLTPGTPKEGTFNAGTEVWSNPLKAKEKKLIAERAAELAGLPRGTALTPLDLHQHPALGGTGTGSSAIDLLREGFKAVATEEQLGADGGLEDNLLKRLATLEDKVKLAEGGKVDGPDAIRRLLHDAIDRTELGDRSDTINARQFKLQVPFGGPVAAGVNLYTTIGGSQSSGMIVNVQANNDCVQLTMGKIHEVSGSAGLTVGVSGDAMPDRDKARVDKTPLSVNLPGAAVKYEQKQRTDPAVVLKISIEPEKGLRDLADARGALKAAVDLLVDFKPGVSRDSAGVPYASAYEMLCDKMDAPFTIDDEVRKTTSIAAEATVSGGRVALKLPNKDDDHARLGLGVTTRYVRNIDIMRSSNQQGATEKYDTRKHTWKFDAFLGVNTPKTTIRESDGKVDPVTGQTGTRPKFTFPIIAGLGGGVDINIGGSEVKDKFPVGTDKFVAYKKEYGNYSRDMQHAILVMLESLPSVANRVQEVVDKGFRELLEAELAEAAKARGPRGEPTPGQKTLRDQLASLQADIDRLHGAVDGLHGEIAVQEQELAALEGSIAQRQQTLETRKQDLGRPSIYSAFLDAEEAPVREQLGEELHNRRALLQQNRTELVSKRTLHRDCVAQLQKLDTEVATRQVVDKELAKMEAEVLMNFGRALMLQRTDRFSVKLESKQQWAHRGIDGAIEIAVKDGNEGLANVMRHVAAKVFENDKDQAVKYLIAAGDLSVKQTKIDVKGMLDLKNPGIKNLTSLAGMQRLEVKGMTEDPVPDTRTATLNPTAQRLIGVRTTKIALTDLQQAIINTSLGRVTPPPPPHHQQQGSPASSTQ